MKIQRQFHAKNINKVVNHPDVYPWICGDLKDPLDLTQLVEDQRNVLLMGEHGGVLFHYIQPGIYEVHTQALPSGRGKWIIDFVKLALHWMFCRTDAVELFTRVPYGNKGAKGLVRAIHGKREFTNQQGWTLGTRIVPADIYTLRLQDWTLWSDTLESEGQWFHDELERKLSERGQDNHEDDPVHDRFVGLACSMIKGGQIEKAMIFYNRWAVMAGYAPCRVLSVNPVILDIHTAKLLVQNDNFQIL